MTALRSFAWTVVLSLTLAAVPSNQAVHAQPAQIQQAQAQQDAPMIRILLKSDADEMFRTAREEWVTKVDAMVTAGVATARGTPEAELTMVLGTEVGALLTILPVYRKREDRARCHRDFHRLSLSQGGADLGSRTGRGHTGRQGTVAA